MAASGILRVLLSRRSSSKLWTRSLFSGADLYKRDFINRTKELQALDSMLTPESIGSAGKIILVTGPKDSGKTALLREFVARQRSGQYSGVPVMVDMRQRSNMDPQAFATNLAHSFSDSLKLKASAKVNTTTDISCEIESSRDKVILSTPAGSVEIIKKALPQPDQINLVMSAFESYMGLIPKIGKGFYNAFPTFFIDEANALGCWENPQDVDTLLRFIVRVTKQEGHGNAVFASSENFFRAWLCGSSALKGHKVECVTVGHLSEDEAKGYLFTIMQKSRSYRGDVDEEVLAIWDDVYAHLGGHMLLLEDFAKLAIHAGPCLVKESWETQKNLLVMQARQAVSYGLYPDAFLQALVPKHGCAPAWHRDHWMTAITDFAEAAGGVVSYDALATKITATALNSMMEYDLVHYRVYTGLDRDLVEVPKRLWPVVMPMTKLQHRAMQQIVAEAK